MTTWSSDQIRKSGASMEADFNGVTLRGISKLDMSDEVKRDLEYGNGSLPIGIPAGSYAAELTIETIPEEADNLYASLGSGVASSIGSMGVSFFEPSGGDPIVYNIAGIYIQGRSASVEAGGQKANRETIKAIITQPIDWNGIQLVEQTFGGFGGLDLGGLL